MLNSLINHEPVTMKDWKIKEIRNICSFFVKNKFCAEHSFEVDQIRAVAEKVNKIYNHKEGYLRHILIDESPELRRYLMVRSVFSRDAKSEGDWLNQEMLKIFDVTDDDMEWFLKKEEVPQELLKLIEGFDPEPLCEADLLDSIQIKYDFWGFGGPIKVIDKDWISEEEDRVDVPRYLSQYTTVTSYPISEEAAVMEDDLPF